MKMPPVKIGEIIKLGVMGFGKKGNPFFRYKNYVIFLENYKDIPLTINQMMSIKIIKVFHNYGFADIVKE